MKTLAEIVSDVHRNTPEERQCLVRTMSCPSYLSKLSDSSNAIVSINESSRPRTGTSATAMAILPAKRSCSEQSANENNDEHESITRPSKRLVHCNDERAPTLDKVDAPLPVPSKSQSAVDPPEGCCPASSSKVSEKRSRKRLSRSSAIDNNSELNIRPIKSMRQQQQKSTKQQSAALETWKLNIIKSRQRSNEQQQEEIANGEANHNLLSNFVTYVDQLPNNPTYEKVSLRSPSSRGSRQQQQSMTNNNLLDNDDGVPMCMMDCHGRRSTQSTAVNTLSSKSQQHSASKSSRPSNFSKVSILLRAFFVICSCLTFISRCMLWFSGSGSSILNSMIDKPLVWTLRFYISTFHLALIIVELGLGIPIILPRGETLTILTQRGFIQSFLGIIDLFLHSNKAMSLAESISSLEGALLSARERRVQISYAIISVSARGMIFIGVLYCLFGLMYDEYNGKKKKHLMDT